MFSSNSVSGRVDFPKWKKKKLSSYICLLIIFDIQQTPNYHTCACIWIYDSSKLPPRCLMRSSRWMKHQTSRWFFLRRTRRIQLRLGALAQGCHKAGLNLPLMMCYDVLKWCLSYLSIYRPLSCDKRKHNLVWPCSRFQQLEDHKECSGRRTLS